MTNQRILTRHCEILARKSKQSILAIRESKAIRLLYMNLRLDLLIRFWIIARIYLLMTRDLDCHAEPKARLAMTSKGSESAIRFAIINKTHPLAPSAREGESHTNSKVRKW